MTAESMSMEEMERLMGLSLEEKIAHSKKIIKEAIDKFGVDNLALAWTGGKDSTTMTWLFRESCKELGVKMPMCMFIDEGYVFEEIWDIFNQLKKEWNLDARIAKNIDVASKAEKVGDMVKVSSLNERNRKEIALLEITDEEFPFEPESFIGNHLMKTIAMNMFLEENKITALATAIRWDEQEARVQETFFSPRKNPPHMRIQPILHFKERDIWDFIFQYKVPFCTLYNIGYRSLGAKGSTTKMSDIPAWEQDLENTYERAGRGQGKEEIMSKLRDLGYM
ncbi:MAG: phosphoadenosine phosphosulfate reductase family protein [Thermodesulfovibrionia bacterium]|nr:phosphoadenosine phosphosulfate reductase family protein [Thermodesulfovibrionia bacterium]